MRYDAKRAGVASVWEREKQVGSSSEAITSSRLVWVQASQLAATELARMRRFGGTRHVKEPR